MSDESTCPRCGRSLLVHPCTYDIERELDALKNGSTPEERATVRELRGRVTSLQSDLDGLRHKVEDIEALPDLAARLRRFGREIAAAADKLDGRTT